MKNTKKLYNRREKFINFLKDYSRMVPEVKYKSIHEEEPKTLTPKAMLQRLPIALTQIKARNTTENLLNEIRQVLYFLYQANNLLNKYIRI